MADNEGGAHYSIRAVAQATGLTVETLRAWERRYGVIEPKRDVSGHRIYTACDVNRLRRLRETTDRGHPIGKIAHLSEQDLACLLSDREDDHAPNGAARAFAERIMAAVEGYHVGDCDTAISTAFALLPADDVVRDVLSPVLRETGERWHRGEFTVAQERLLSSSVRRLVGGLLNTFNGLAHAETVVFATVSGEQHELGILMYAVLAASRKLRALYLGPDLPAREIADLARRTGAAAVAISLIMPEEINLSLQQLAIMRDALPPETEIWIGGGASCHVDPARFPAGSIHMAGSADFEHRVELLALRGR